MRLQKSRMRVLIAVSNPTKDPVRCRVRPLGIGTKQFWFSLCKWSKGWVVCKITLKRIILCRTSALVLSSPNFPEEITALSAVRIFSCTGAMVTTTQERRPRRAWKLWWIYDEWKNMLLLFDWTSSCLHLSVICLHLPHGKVMPIGLVNRHSSHGRIECSLIEEFWHWCAAFYHSYRWLDGTSCVN